jgi:hypothetical protein
MISITLTIHDYRLLRDRTVCDVRTSDLADTDHDTDQGD